jgi:Sulfotransferase domain
MLDAGRGAEYLEFSVKEGWEPLCGFLGREVPRDEEGKVKPFPKVNDRATFGQTCEPYFEALFRQIFWRGVMGLGAVVVFVGAWLWTRENV